MAFAFEFTDDGVVRWEPGGRSSVDRDYAPTFYVAVGGGTGGRSADVEGRLADLRDRLERRPAVVDARPEEHRTGFRRDPEAVLAVDVEGPDRLRSIAREVRESDRPGTYRCFDVDLAPGFRYCLDTDTDPVPDRPPAVLELSVPPGDLADGSVRSATVGGGWSRTRDGAAIPEESVEGDPETVLEAVGDRMDGVDPDVLVVNAADVVPVVHDAAADAGVAASLGRREGYRTLAGESTFESYGQVHHSPARYDLPGRALVDRSNAFFPRETNLAGCLDLVGRSRRPLQELSWASIGTVLTAIQIREARRRDVLVPWKSRRHELFKSMGTLHDADRGGVTLSPGVGYHRRVHELDFSSLYPNVIRTRNVSPDAVRCDCHAGRSDVPGLGYAICDDRGYLPDVLDPIVEDRAAIKAELADCEDPDRRAVLEGRSSALKWILVACFGYQGFSNAKFGRIECHEAINAFAREILLTAKDRLEAGGWRVLHGIVDSLWVTPGDDRYPVDRRDLGDVADDVTDEVGIDLEYEGAYDWIAFAPRRDDDAGALTRYFGKRADPAPGEDRFKLRGIEARQRSTPPFVADCQRELLGVVDRTMDGSGPEEGSPPGDPGPDADPDGSPPGPDPRAVCDRLRLQVRRLERGEVDPADLAIAQRTSRDPGEYDQYTRAVAATERARDRGLPAGAGRTVEYVVVDDEKDSRDRVALAGEDPDDYDPAFYRDLLVRAAESVLSPAGWRREDIAEYLADTEETSLGAYRA